MLETHISKKTKLISIGIPIRKIGNFIEIWMQKRIEDGPLNGFLEFPGGKIKKNENPVTALQRELLEEVGHRFEQWKFFKVYPYKYSDRSVVLYVYIIEKDFENEAGSWYELNSTNIGELHKEVLEANKAILDDLLRLFCNE